MACPGSIQLSRQVPAAPSSEFAREGTRAHSVAQLSLEKNVEPHFFVGMEIEGAEIDEEMADYVKVFTDYCRSLIIYRDSQWWVERKFNLAKLNPPGPMFGTADFVAYNASTRTLHVVDLKYGQGVVVEARGNKQLRYYGLGAWLSLEQLPVATVAMTIVQPRAAHPDGMIRTEEIPVDELVEFADDLMKAAHRTLEADPPFQSGSHCRFCPASGICPAQRERALAVAQADFEVITEPEPRNVLPSPEVIPVEQLSEILGKLHILEDWAAAVRGRAQAMLERGEEVPGFKLVAKRANRKWVNEDGVADLLEASGVDEETALQPRKLKSPAQIEKALGKKRFNSLALSELVVKQSSGYNMVPATDPRPAISPLEEFTLIPATTGGGKPEGPETE